MPTRQQEPVHIDHDEIRQFFVLLTQDAAPDAWVVVSRADKQSFLSQWFRPADIETAVRYATQYAATHDVYMGIGIRNTTCCPSETTRGSSADVFSICGLWIEFDHSGGVHKTPGHLLPTRIQLLQFVDQFPFRFSLLIDSSGGVHGYLLFKEPWLLNTTDEREKADRLLRRFQRTIQAWAADRGWKVDSTADLARVLRPAGTLNHKSGAPQAVSILHEDALRYNPSDITDADWLAPFEEMYTPAAPSGTFPITHVDAIVRGCPWLKHCRDDAAQLPEPEWYGMLGVIGRCANGPDTAHEWSNPYPGYSKDETNKKLQHALKDAGPRTCTSIRFSLGADVYCRSCAYWGKIKSPIVLGISHHGSRNGAVPPFAPSKTPSTAQTPYGDVYNAEALIAKHGEELRYSYAWNTWLIWSGSHWKRDETGEIMRRARETLKHLLSTATDDQIHPVLKHLRTAFSHRNLTAMCAQAQSLAGIPVRPEECDADVWLLNCPNGTVDLRTGHCYAHAKADMLTKCTSIPYKADATCPTWDRFLWRIMGGTVSHDSPDMSTAEMEVRYLADMRARRFITFLQRAVGYSLAGIVREKALFIPYGTGDNGKTTFIEAIESTLGPDYAMRTPTELFIAKRENAIPNDLARLKGARFVYASEPDEGKRLAEGLIKELTGGDTVSARFMRGEWFTFRPEFTLWLSTNHKPHVRGTDKAIWKRLKLLPFTTSIPEADQDKTLPQKLIAEREGILAWAVRGCLDWQRDGLAEPEEVHQATAAYRAEMDVVGQFLADSCLQNEAMRTRATKLYEAYRQWCEHNGEYAVSQKRFGSTMREKQFTPYENKGIWYLGIGLLEHESTPARGG